MAQSELKKNIQRLSKKRSADIFVFSGAMQPTPVDSFRDLVCSRQTRSKNVVLFITTYGGDADSAFRLFSTLRQYYTNVYAYVFGYCKSAGTLAVVGANEVVMGNFGELGPLDVQLTKPDEIIGTSSGLDIFQALSVIANSAFETFERYFLSIASNSQGNISAKTSAEIARSLAVGLFGPMTEQVDPERLGEVQRAINIANAYGHKLNKGNLKPGALERLVQGYPTHGFVIDFEEARTLFRAVRRADPLENAVANGLPYLRRPAKEPTTFDLLDFAVSKPAPGGTNATKPKAATRAKPKPAAKPSPAAGGVGAAGNVASIR